MKILGDACLVRMDAQEQLRNFALKAREAERKATRAADEELRQVWEDIGRNWRLLARQLRVLGPPTTTQDEDVNSTG